MDSQDLEYTRGAYVLRLSIKPNGKQALALYRITNTTETKVCDLDMADIERQCQPSALIKRICQDMNNNVQAVEYRIDNHKFESAENALNEYHNTVNSAVEKATKLIASIAHDATSFSAPVINYEDTPF